MGQLHFKDILFAHVCCAQDVVRAICLLQEEHRTGSVPAGGSAHKRPGSRLDWRRGAHSRYSFVEQLRCSHSLCQAGEGLDPTIAVGACPAQVVGHLSVLLSCGCGHGVLLVVSYLHHREEEYTCLFSCSRTPRTDPGKHFKTLYLFIVVYCCRNR